MNTNTLLRRDRLPKHGKWICANEWCHRQLSRGQERQGVQTCSHCHCEDKLIAKEPDAERRILMAIFGSETARRRFPEVIARETN